MENQDRANNSKSVIWNLLNISQNRSPLFLILILCNWPKYLQVTFTWSFRAVLLSYCSERSSKGPQCPFRTRQDISLKTSCWWQGLVFSEVVSQWLMAGAHGHENYILVPMERCKNSKLDSAKTTERSVISDLAVLKSHVGRGSLLSNLKITSNQLSAVAIATPDLYEKKRCVRNDPQKRRASPHGPWRPSFPVRRSTERHCQGGCIQGTDLAKVCELLPN